MFPVAERTRPSTQYSADHTNPVKINPLLESMAHWLDNAIPVPGTPWRVGLDGLIGMIPVVGDLATAFSGLLMMREAQRLGVSKIQQGRILVNYMIDTLIGMIPLVGDLFDFAFKANQKSLNILKRHVEWLNSQRGAPPA